MKHLFRRARWFGVVGAIVVFTPAPGYSQESRSAALAGELVKLLDTQKLDSIAAAQSDAFVGALYIPGSQLLVVRGRFASPDHAAMLIKSKKYRDVYLDLFGAADVKTKMFIYDLGADGLKLPSGSNQPFDTVELAGKSYAFDGDWDKAKISKDEYNKTYETTDQQYQQMLEALVNQLKKPS